MRALVQRVRRASVSVGAERVAEIGPGLLVLVCAMRGDGTAEAEALAKKLSKLRIFRDDDARMNLSVLDSGGSALVVSQFTLGADTARGNRPGFSNAAPPDEGERLYLHFAAHLSGLGVPVQTGCFGADMDVELVNQGPVTIWLDVPPAGQTAADARAD